MNVNQEQSKSTYKWIYSKTPPLNIYKLAKYGSELPIQRPACSKKAAVNSSQYKCSDDGSVSREGCNSSQYKCLDDGSVSREGKNSPCVHDFRYYTTSRDQPDLSDVGDLSWDEGDLPHHQIKVNSDFILIWTFPYVHYSNF